MSGKEIGAGTSCFLIKDKRMIGNWYKTPIHDFLEEEGFVNWGKAKSHDEVDWLSLVYSHSSAFEVRSSI